MKRSPPKRFYLIELMIVVAIIGILAASWHCLLYRSYMQKARFSEVVLQGSSCRADVGCKVSDYYGGY